MTGRMARMASLAPFVVALAVAAGLAPPASPALASGFEITVDAGFPGNASQPGDWIPVAVTVDNKSGDFRGTLGVAPVGAAVGNSLPYYGAQETGPPGNATERIIDVVLPAGSTRRYTVWMVAASNLAVTLRDGGGRAAGVGGATVLIASGDLHVGLVSDARDPLPALAGLNVGSQTVYVHRLAATDLPENGVLLHGLRMLVFDDASTDTLTGSQRRALDDYVSAGGGLVLAGGSGAKRTLAGLPAGLAPVRLDGTRDLGGVPNLAALLGQPAPRGTVTVATVTPAAGAVAVVADGGAPMLVDARHGLGRVLFTAFDPDVEPLASWSGQRALLRQAVVRLAAPASGTGATASLLSPGRASNVVQALAQIPSLALPSLALSGLALLAYVFVAGPGNYLVLKRLGRRDLAWVTIPAVVLASSAAAYGVGLHGRGAALISRARVLVVDGDRAYVETYTGVFLPSRGSHTVSTGGDGLVTDVSNVSCCGYYRKMIGGSFVTGTYSSGIPNQVTNDGTTTVTGSGSAAEVRFDGVPAYTMRPYATQGFADAGGGVAEALTLSQGTISGSVVNNLPFDLHDAVVLAGNRATPVGALLRGRQAQVSVTGYSPDAQDSGNGVDLAQQVFPDMYSSGSQDHQRRGRLIQAFFQSAGPAFTPPVLVAWGGSGGELSVDGQQASVSDIDMVVVPLYPAIGRGAFSGGDMTMGLVDVQQTRSTSFNGGSDLSQIAMPAGAVAVYEAALPPGARWSDLRLTVNHISTGGRLAGCVGVVTKGVPVPVPVPVPAPPPVVIQGGAGFSSGTLTLPAPAPPVPVGCNRPLAVQFFDFATGAWTKLPAVTAGTGAQDLIDLGAVPGLVSPDGVVEVRLLAPADASGPQITSVLLAGQP